MFQLKSTCRKGLHSMVEGSYRLEIIRSKNGRQYLARRCRQCQLDRYRAGLQKKQRPDVRDLTAGIYNDSFGSGT